MSGLGGGKPGGGFGGDDRVICQARNAWLSASDSTSVNASANNTLTEKVRALNKHIEQLTKRIEQLETAYMEIKLLGKEDVQNKD